MSGCTADAPGDFEMTYEYDTSSSKSKDSKLSIAATIGIVFGDVALMLIIVLGVWYIFVRYVSKAARRVNSETSVQIKQMKRQTSVASTDIGI